MEDDNISIRLKLFMEYMQITNSQFADSCGIPRPTLSQLLSGRNKKISDVLVKQIHDRYPQLSVLWLMFGEGEMINPTELDSVLASEASKFLDDDAFIDENGKENELNEIKNARNLLSSSEITNVSRHSELTIKKNNSFENPRKVVSITVFYDDNSYETFFPSKK